MEVNNNNKMNTEDRGDVSENQNEVAAGIEFHKETPVEAKKEDPAIINKKRTEMVGGVEFAKEDKRKKEEAKPAIDDDAVHTMAEDMGEQAERKQGAALQAVLKEERTSKEDRKKREKSLVFSLISVVLFAAAIGVFMFASKEEESVVPITQVVQESLLYSENHTRIDTTNIQAITLVSKIVQKVSVGEAAAGEVTNIYFTRSLPAGGVQTLNSRQFLSSVQSSIPGVLLPMIGKDFMFGVFSGNTRKPFLVFEVDPRGASQYVKGWESNMLQEFGRVFDLDIRNPEIYSKEFVDHQIENKDMRVLLDESDNLVLGYAFLNDELLVVFTEQITFNEILQRLATQF